MTKLSLLASLLFSAAIPAAFAQAPANDNFANSQSISTGLTTTNITNATVEAGERDTSTGQTVWYSYTATSDSVVTIDTTGIGFNHSFVTVYMGTAINTLIQITGGYKQDIVPFTVSFNAKAGRTYKICAGHQYAGFYGSGREVKLTLFTTPFNHTGTLYSNETPADGYVTNDRFDNRTALSGKSLTVNSYMMGSSVEAGEPDTNSGKTVWYTYTAASDSVVSIDTTGTQFYHHFVSIYMGTSINNLTEVTSGYRQSVTPFSFKFKAKAGTTYQICAGSLYDNIDDNAGLLQFTLTTTGFTYAGTLFGPAVPIAPTPANDSFSKPQVLSGNLLTVIGSNTSATIEAGESGISRTLWYSWKPSKDKYVVVDFSDASNFASGTFGVFTGATPQTAVQVPQIPGSPAKTYAFNAKAGKTYRILLASTNDFSSAFYGPFLFTLKATDPKPNDAPFAKITSPANNAPVSVNGFPISAYVNDDDGISAFQIKINGTLKISKPFPYSGALFSGKVKKGVVTVEIRAKDTLGKWGPYRKIKVNAK